MLHDICLKVQLYHYQMDLRCISQLAGNGLTKATIHADLERVIGHTGTGDTAQTPTEAVVGNLRNGRSLTEQRRVSEEGFRIVKLCC